MQRDREFEREATSHYGRSVDVALLNDFAESRADAHGQELPDASRDLRRETLEELADARNYLVWWMQATGGEVAVLALGEALGAVAHAFSVLAGEPRTVPATHMMAGAKRWPQ